MATVKVIRKSEKTNNSKQAPLYLRIIKDRKPKYVALGILLKKEEWDEGKSRVTKKHYNSGYLNKYIAKKVLEAETLSLDLDKGTKFITSKKIKEDIMGKPPTDFFIYAQKFITMYENSRSYGVYKKVKTVVDKLKKYNNDAPLMINEIDYTFLKKYEDYLVKKKKNGQNTITSNFKVIRKLINEAVNENIITRNDNPFYKIKLKNEPSKREFLTEEELETIEKLNLPVGTNICDYRNAYVFATYAGGLRISDILQLKWQNFDGERLNLIMAKTNRQLNIKLPGKAIEIINIYKKEDSKSEHFIFPFLRNDKDYSSPKVLLNSLSSATTMANHALIKIAKKAK
ncbi:MAG: site-specific integrase, partial [Bacteroidales bacterium]|nr:site-specific integrase [Bacteroidales bacterium]